MDMMIKQRDAARSRSQNRGVSILLAKGGQLSALIASKMLAPHRTSRSTQFLRSNQPGVLAFAAALLACSLCAHAEDTTADLIKKAKLVSRRGIVADTQSAYEKVFAAKDLTVEQRVAAHMDIARVMQRGRKPQLKEAMAEYEKALAITSLPARERYQIRMGVAKVHYRSNYVDKRGSYHTRGIDAARAIYEEVASSDKVDNQTRVEAYSLLADCYFDRMEVAAATRSLKEAAELPGLSVEERHTAEFNLARGFQRQLDHASARKMYDRLLAATKDAVLKNSIVKEYTLIFAAAGNLDEGAKLMRQAGRYEWQIAAFYFKHGQKEKGTALYHKILDDPKADERARWNTFARICRGGDFAQVMKLGDRYLDGFTKVDPKRITHLLTFLSRGYMGPYYVSYDSRANPRFIVWLAGKLLPYEGLSPKDRLRISSHLINAHLDLRNLSEAVAAAKAVAANETFKASEREQYKLIASVIDRKTEASRLKTAAEALLKTCGDEKLPVIEQVQFLEQVARVAVRALNHPAAKAVDAVRAPLIKKEPRRSLNCEFV
jgi:tetratricopeptide (TPR) repeat protein